MFIYGLRGWQKELAELKLTCEFLEMEKLRWPDWPLEVSVVWDWILNWRVDGLTIQEFAAHVKMMSERLGPPDTLQGDIPHGETARLTARWRRPLPVKIGYANRNWYFVQVMDYGAKGCKLDPRFKPHDYEQDPRLHPECEGVLKEIKEELTP